MASPYRLPTPAVLVFHAVTQEQQDLGVSFLYPHFSLNVLTFPIKLIEFEVKVKGIHICSSLWICCHCGYVRDWSYVLHHIT